MRLCETDFTSVLAVNLEGLNMTRERLLNLTNDAINPLGLATSALVGLILRYPLLLLLPDLRERSVGLDISMWLIAEGTILCLWGGLVTARNDSSTSLHKKGKMLLVVGVIMLGISPVPLSQYMDVGGEFIKLHVYAITMFAPLRFMILDLVVTLYLSLLGYRISPTLGRLIFLLGFIIFLAIGLVVMRTAGRI